MSPKDSRNYWIDCLRGYSISIVLICHSFYIEPIHNHIGFLSYYIKGDTGVHIFYFLSGFLVTTIIYREMAGNFFDRLKSALMFLGRRIFRLQPTLIMFLFLYFVLAQRTPDDLKIWQLIVPVSNLYGGPYISWHLKTLHLEEVFYISATGFLLIAGTGNLKKKLLFGLLLLIGLRIFSFAGRKFGCEFPDGIMSYLSSFDPIIIGSLTGLSFDRIRASCYGRFFEKHPHASFLSALFLILLIAALRPVKPFSYLFTPSWPTLLSLLCIPIVVSFYEVNGILKSKWINYVGVISYSVYLFQQFAFGPQAEIFGKFDSMNWISTVIFVLIGAPLWSYFIERPLTQFGAYLFPRKEKQTPVKKLHQSAALAK